MVSLIQFNSLFIFVLKEKVGELLCALRSQIRMGNKKNTKIYIRFSGVVLHRNEPCGTSLSSKKPFDSKRADFS
jgi:hypothetical protein